MGEAEVTPAARKAAILEEMGMDLDAYYESLDASLVEYANGNKQPFYEHCQKYDLLAKVPNNEIARHGAVMKMITARKSLPMAIRKTAKQWLVDHNFSSWDDGDVQLIESEPKQ